MNNPETTVFIEMKPGCYVPKFLLRSEMKQPAPAYQAPSYQNIGTHSQATETSHTGEPAPAASDVAPVTQNSESESEQSTGISQLWQAYKSTSKVA